jgi:hypothetical protein
MWKKTADLACRTGHSDDSLPTLFVPLRLAQPDPWSPAVPLDELDAGCLQRPANGQIVSRRHGRVTFSELRTSDGSQTDR